MKKYFNITLMCSAFLLTLLCMRPTPAMAQDKQTADRYELIVTGTVRDKDTGEKLDNVTVSLEGTSIGTVTNADGYFSLKFPRGIKPTLIFSLLGYENIKLTTKETGDGRYVADVSMKVISTELGEVVVFGDARGVVEAALRKISSNYPTSLNLLSAFYRETVQKGRRYISVSEAIMDVYKTSYALRSARGDAVRLEKARRLLSQKASDTLGVKIVGGPNLSLTIDVVKNGGELFDENTLDYYSLIMLPPEMIDDRAQYVVGFFPLVHIDRALHIGKVYIDKENLAFTRAEFSLDLSDPDKATQVLLYNKPIGLRFQPQEVTFLVTYRNDGGVTRLNYIKSLIRFKCDWKRLTFSSGYTTCSEMVVVDREGREGIVIDRKGSFGDREVFYDKVEEYWDEDFWSEYNIIEPTESLENAVKRLKKRQ